MAYTNERPEIDNNRIYAASRKPHQKNRLDRKVGHKMTRVIYKNGSYDYVLTSQLERLVKEGKVVAIL